MQVILCVNATRAQVVLQVGRKANWSNSNYLGRAGLNRLLTNIFSARRERIGVTDIGLYSEKLAVHVFFGTGVTIAFNHYMYHYM